MRNDGGAAFARPAWNQNAEHEYRQDGLSRLEFFASAALTGLCASTRWPENDDEDGIAKLSFEIARAMLRESQKEKKS